MRRITAISLLVVSAATVAVMPAQAQGVAARTQVQRAVVTGGACARSFADARCASYQRRMIADVTSAASAKPISVEEAGKRQLDALMRTIG